MAEIGLVFQKPMVLAFLAGRKSQTRRTLSAARCLVDGHGMSAKRWAAMDFDWDSAIIDPGPSPAGNPGPYLHVHSRANGTTHRIYPRARVGDRMWVRETWADPKDGDGICGYRATDEGDYALTPTWRSPIHMPRLLARIERDIVRLRFERLCAITDADAIAEGCPGGHGSIPNYPYSALPTEHFYSVWQSIHGQDSWERNPLLLVYDFAEVRPCPSP